jgi:hypothetical protein
MILVWQKIFLCDLIFKKGVNMKINNIQSYNRVNHSPAFGVKFNQKDINTILNSVSEEYIYGDKGADYSIYPKVYTMLKYLEEIPGDKAYIRYITLDNNWKPQILTDESTMYNLARNNEYVKSEICISTKGCSVPEVIGENDGNPASLVKALERATLAFSTDKHADETNKEFHEKYIHMPRIIFEQEWWKNRHKTSEDIRKLAIDA